MITDDQILAIGRRALDKCFGTDAQHVYLAREVERLVTSRVRVNVKVRHPDGPIIGAQYIVPLAIECERDE